MKFWRPTADMARVLGIALVLAGIVHICVTFALPTLTGSREIAKFAASLPLNRMELLAPVAPASQPLPFMTPDTRYAVCRYDTSNGAVAVSLSLPEPGWVMALYSLEGENFYYVTGQPTRRIDLALLLVPPTSEQVLGTAAEASPVAPAGAPVPVATRQGLLVVRAPERGVAYRPLVEAELKKARCAPRRN